MVMMYLQMNVSYIIFQVLEGKAQYIEMAGNLVPVTKSGDQLYINFHAFRENRLPFNVRIRDSNLEPVGRIAFMKEPKVSRGEAPQSPICNLNINLPDQLKVSLCNSKMFLFLFLNSFLSVV